MLWYGYSCRLSSIRKSLMGRVCPDLQVRREDISGRCPADSLLPVLCGVLWEILSCGPAGKAVAIFPGNFRGLNYKSEIAILSM